MKHEISTIVCGLALLAAATSTGAADEAAVRASRAAWAALDKIAKERMRRDFQGGFASYWHSNIDAAREMYESVLMNGVFLNEQKVDALRQVAQMHLEATRDEEAALGAMECAFALPGLSGEEKSRAEAVKLDLLRMMRRVPPDSAKAKQIPTLSERAAAARVVDFRSGKPSPDAVRSYFDACLNAGYDAFFSRVPAMLSELEVKHPGANYWPIALEVATSWYRLRNSSRAQRDRRFPTSLVALLEGAPDGRVPSAAAMFGYVNGKPGLEDKCRAYAEKVVSLASDPKANVRHETLAEAKKFLLFDAAGTNVERIVAACRSILADVKKENGAEVQMAKLIGERAQLQLKAGREDIARRLWIERLKIAPERAQSKLDCPYWKDSPHDLRGIVESDFCRNAPKGLFTHRYGDNLKFLIETDSAITSREMTTDNGEKFRPTELFAFCDAQGVKLLIRAYLDNMDAVRAGDAGVPGYEAYLATGIDDPYHCFMLDPVEGGRPEDNFVTQYDNGTGYRNLKDRLGNLRCDSLYLDDGVATLVSVPWASVPTSIPPRSPAWYFEAINWAHGGLSWGGSKSVHSRSKFGVLRFTGIDDEALSAIHRALLREARRAMAAAKDARTGGCVEKWADPVLGDQEFYLSAVKPLVTRIERDLSRAGKDATPETVGQVFASGSVDDAINIDYRVALLRTEWLEERMTE